MKILIIYYSRTGVTKKAAEILKDKLAAEIEVLADTVNRQGALGYLKSGREAMKKISPEILPLKRRPEDYDLIIIGTPVWAFTMSSPIRSFLQKYRTRIKKAAFFRTQGGAGSEGTFKEMSGLLGQAPVAELVLLTKEVISGQVEEKINQFTNTLKNI